MNFVEKKEKTHPRTSKKRRGESSDLGFQLFQHKYSPLSAGDDSSCPKPGATLDRGSFAPNGGIPEKKIKKIFKKLKKKKRKKEL